MWIRELGFGINPALTWAHRVNDVSTFERMSGIHVSLGAKHGVYAKAGFSKRRARFHVDIFVVADRVEIDQEVVFEHSAYAASLRTLIDATPT